MTPAFNYSYSLLHSYMDPLLAGSPIVAENKVKEASNRAFKNLTDSYLSSYLEKIASVKPKGLLDAIKQFFLNIFKITKTDIDNESNELLKYFDDKYAKLEDGYFVLIQKGRSRNEIVENFINFYKCVAFLHFASHEENLGSELKKLFNEYYNYDERLIEGLALGITDESFKQIIKEFNEKNSGFKIDETTFLNIKNHLTESQKKLLFLFDKFKQGNNKAILDELYRPSTRFFSIVSKNCYKFFQNHETSLRQTLYSRFEKRIPTKQQKTDSYNPMSNSFFQSEANLSIIREKINNFKKSYLYEFTEKKETSLPTKLSRWHIFSNERCLAVTITRLCNEILEACKNVKTIDSKLLEREIEDSRVFIERALYEEFESLRKQIENILIKEASKNSSEIDILKDILGVKLFFEIGKRLSEEKSIPENLEKYRANCLKFASDEAKKLIKEFSEKNKNITANDKIELNHFAIQTINNILADFSQERIALIILTHQKYLLDDKRYQLGKVVIQTIKRNIEDNIKKIKFEALKLYPSQVDQKIYVLKSIIKSFDEIKQPAVDFALTEYKFFFDEIVNDSISDLVFDDFKDILDLQIDEMKKEFEYKIKQLEDFKIDDPVRKLVEFNILSLENVLKNFDASFENLLTTLKSKPNYEKNRAELILSFLSHGNKLSDKSKSLFLQLFESEVKKFQEANGSIPEEYKALVSSSALLQNYSSYLLSHIKKLADQSVENYCQASIKSAENWNNSIEQHLKSYFIKITSANSVKLETLNKFFYVKSEVELEAYCKELSTKIHDGICHYLEEKNLNDFEKNIVQQRFSTYYCEQLSLRFVYESLKKECEANLATLQALEGNTNSIEGKINKEKLEYCLKRLKKCEYGLLEYLIIKQPLQNCMLQLEEKAKMLPNFSYISLFQEKNYRSALISIKQDIEKSIASVRQYDSFDHIALDEFGDDFLTACIHLQIAKKAEEELSQKLINDSSIQDLIDEEYFKSLALFFILNPFKLNEKDVTQQTDEIDNEAVKISLKEQFKKEYQAREKKVLLEKEERWLEEIIGV
jgi:hypothetical protein